MNEAVILENWDDFRLVALSSSRKQPLPTSSAGSILYSRQHELYRAVKAFGQIIKSIFILRHIDDLELRQAIIEKQLNKVELANRFTRAVAVGNPRESTQAEKEEQEIAEACNRLIKNRIIWLNHLYLSRKIAEARSDEERQRLLASIASHSPIAWSYINLLGEYDLPTKSSSIPSAS
ncbi:MAG: Tn3 family transposase [Geminicoccaceae bacterium]